MNDRMNGAGLHMSHCSFQQEEASGSVPPEGLELPDPSRQPFVNRLAMPTQQWDPRSNIQGGFLGPLFAQLEPKGDFDHGDLRLQAWTTGPPWSLFDTCLSQDPAGEGHLQFWQDCLHPKSSTSIRTTHREQQERLVQRRENVSSPSRASEPQIQEAAL